MKKILKDEKTKNLIIGLTTSGICIILFYLMVVNIDVILAYFTHFLYVLSPFIWGIVFALLVMPFCNWLEKLMGTKLSKGKKRAISATAGILLIIGALALFSVILLPQLVSSLNDIIIMLQNVAESSKDIIMELESKFAISTKIFEILYEYSEKIIAGILDFVQGNVPGVLGYVTSVFTNVGNFFMGFVIAMYILLDREHLYAQFSKLFKAILPTKGFNYLAHVKDICVDRFGKFFIGKLIDSTIIGVICYIILLILKIDYAVLISFVVGVTNMIPFFGPIIGAIPGIIILLIVDPWQAVIFTIVIVILQQVDGNFIGPNILGNKIGISSLWIMVAIILGSAYFGFFGMLLGVPVFSIIYALVKEAVNNRLEKKKELE